MDPQIFLFVLDATSFVGTGRNMAKYELQGAKQPLCIVTDCCYICRRIIQLGILLNLIQTVSLKETKTWHPLLKLTHKIKTRKHIKHNKIKTNGTKEQLCLNSQICSCCLENKLYSCSLC